MFSQLSRSDGTVRRSLHFFSTALFRIFCHQTASGIFLCVSFFFIVYVFPSFFTTCSLALRITCSLSFCPISLNLSFQSCFDEFRPSLLIYWVLQQVLVAHSAGHLHSILHRHQPVVIFDFPHVADYGACLSDFYTETKHTVCVTLANPKLQLRDCLSVCPWSRLVDGISGGFQFQPNQCQNWMTSNKPVAGRFGGK